MSNTSSTNVDAILDRAATQAITPEELDVLVNKTRELKAKRERELSCIKMLLGELEAKQKQP